MTGNDIKMQIQEKILTRIVTREPKIRSYVNSRENLMSRRKDRPRMVKMVDPMKEW